MSFFIAGSKVGRLGVLSEPPTYDADITEIDMGLGKIGYARGKKLIGKGKCFEYAEYGCSKITAVNTEDGQTKYGATLNVGVNTNVLFISTMPKGDAIAQTNFLLSKEGRVKVGENLTAGGDLYAYTDGENTVVYFENVSSTNTFLLYFLGKDNDL